MNAEANIAAKPNPTRLDLDEVRQELIDPECTIIRAKDVSAMTGLARSSVYKCINEDPTFPRPVPLSRSKHRSAPVGFVLAEVQAWIKARIAERNKRADNHEGL